MKGEELSAALVVWTGWGETSWPSRDDSRVVAVYGSDCALDLLPRLRALEDDFYKSEANLTVADLAEMGRVAATQFRKLHPEITESGVAALAWCYTFDFK